MSYAGTRGTPKNKPIPVATMSDEDKRRILARLEKHSIPEPNSGCTLWIGAVDRAGYGTMRMRDGKTLQAHRVAFAIHGNSDPAELSVLHSCDQPACIRQSHLRAGTAADNGMDRKLRGRSYNQRKTHCRYGHEFTPENTYIVNGGARKCRECDLKWRKDKRDANIESARARDRERYWRDPEYRNSEQRRRYHERKARRGTA